jgi:hypothetical protein
LVGESSTAKKIAEKDAHKGNQASLALVVIVSMDEMKLRQMGGDLRSYYWRLRACRGKARSSWYRKISGEKKRLLDAGVDGELLRLYCLYLANPNREARAMRLSKYTAPM